MSETTEKPDLPDVGKAFDMADFDMVMAAVKERQEKHPEEPTTLTLYLILTGIGERFRKIQCVEQEWECLKRDIPLPEEGGPAPTCPNGHSLHEGPGLTLGWVYVE
jgi:hypothetical protein